MHRKSSKIFGIGFVVAVTSAACTSETSTQPGSTLPMGGMTSAGGMSSTGGQLTTIGGTSTPTLGGSSGGGGVTSTTRSSTTAKGGSGGATGGTSAKTSTGGTSTGGTSVSTTIPLGPTKATATSKFPFPQNRFKSGCSYPKKIVNDDVLAVYEQWKSHLVTSDGAGGFRRVKRVDEPGLEKNSTVSEGIAYGMIIAVYMDDQPLFNDLWQYALKYPSKAIVGTSEVDTMLMNWFVKADGSLDTTTDGGCKCQKFLGAATDADEDMAWALVMADKQWGNGSLSKSYLQYAKDLIDAIWKYEIFESKLPRNGARWGDWNSLNVSYFAPAFYRVFAKVSGQNLWGTDVVKTCYDTIEGNLTSANGNQTNGLVPAFSTNKGDAVSGQRHDYQYDSCRTPFRIGVDACLFNESRAKTYVAKTSQFFSQIGAANIKDGYSLDGKPTPEWGSRGWNGLSAAFIGPAGVGAMHSSSYQSFIDDVWGLVKQNNMWCGGQYYDESWGMMTLLMMSGNYLDYTAETPL